ncbi:MAG: hypothetical protein ACUVTX_08545 [Bacteroidales bacterium]
MKRLFKMMPDRTNYEIWIIDYLDGRLSDEQAGLLMEFLNANPDIMDEFKSFIEYKIDAVNVPYPGKNNLKKNPADISENQFNLLCTGYLEKDLSLEQENELQQILAENPDRLKTFALIQKLKLKPPAVEFRYKYKLRKKSTTDKIFRLSVAGIGVAASVTILVYLFIVKQPESARQEMTGTETAINIPLENSINKINPSARESSPNEISRNELAPVNISKEKPTTTPHEIFSELVPDSLIPKASDYFHHETPVITAIKFKTEFVTRQEKPESLQIITYNHPPNLLAEESGNGIMWRLSKFFREKILNSAVNANDEITAYEIAEASINGLNKLLGWQMALNESTNENGEVKAVNFNSKLLKFNIPVKKSESGE